MSGGSEFPLGGVIGERFEVLEVLGEGTTGTVYKARDLHLGCEHEIVALKVIHQQYLSDRQIFGRFRREAAILTRLRGSHLVELLEFIEEDGLLMIALEFVDGPSLEEYLREYGPLSIDEALAIIGQICEALDIAHEGGIVHRDLKPSNVLIEGARTESARSFLSGLSVRVVDFGMAKVLHGEMPGTALTEQDMIFGTPDYMAPEQARGDELDGRCDLYAVAAILFEMLTGRVPFETAGPLTTMAAHLNHPVPSPRAVATECDIPESLDRVIVRALAKKPADRYATGKELSSALVAASLGDEDTASEAPDSMAIRDTQIDDIGAINTTLPSHKNAALEASTGRGAKVTVIVKDAEPDSRSSDFALGKAAPISLIRHDGEKKVWTVAAVLIALLAVVLGIALGYR